MYMLAKTARHTQYIVVIPSSVGNRRLPCGLVYLELPRSPLLSIDVGIAGHGDTTSGNAPARPAVLEALGCLRALCAALNLRC